MSPALKHSRVSVRIYLTSNLVISGQIPKT